MITTETVFIGRDNAIDVQLEDDSVVPGTLANTKLEDPATKVEIIIDDGDKYNSTDNPDKITFTTGGKVTFKLGTHFTEENVYNAQIVVYDSVNVNGILWEPKIVLDAKTDSF